MFYRQLVLCVVAILTVLPVSAQRVFKTIKPPAEMKLVFDTNQYRVGQEDFRNTPLDQKDDDFNYSPNILYSKDPGKAFVSFPGSDAVLAFNPKTGDILAKIPTGTNPASLAMTPDGKKLAVPCLYLADNAPVGENFLGKQIGAVSIIDVETLQVQRLDLTKVQFSFANNIVFSADSKTGFIASFTTDEILRFNVETAAEITPRLAMTAGTRPASLAMAPDFSFFSVVLVGSNRLDMRVTPDTVALIDTANFSKKLQVNTAVADDELSYNFYPVNTVAFSSDGKIGVIAERGASTYNPSPVVNDRAIAFDTADGKILDVYYIGYNASGVYKNPTTDHSFVVVSEIEIASIDPSTKQVGRVYPYALGEYKGTTRPVFTPNGKELYLAMPLLDQIVIMNMVTGETRRLFDSGKLIQPPPSDTDPDKNLPAAPMEVGITPDGEVIAALNYNNNTIDLIRQTDVYALPAFYSGNEWFTGVAITNHSATAEAELKLLGMSRFGIQYQDDVTTTEVVEYKNPKTIKLGPGKQTSFTAGTLLEAVAGKTIEGWLDVDSDLFTTTSFFLVGDPGVTRLDGGPALLNYATTMVLPDIRVVDGFRAELQVMNPTYTLGKAIVRLYNDQGTLLFTTDVADVPTLGVLTGYLRDPDAGGTTFSGIFPDQSFENFTSGYAVVESYRPVTAIARYWDDQRLAVVPAFAKGAGFNQGTNFVVPQFAMFGGSETFLSLMNIGEGPLSVTLTLRANNGDDLSTQVITIEKGKLQRKSVAELFGLTDAGQTTSGWISVVADAPGLIGQAEVRTFSGKAMTTTPLLSPTAKVLSFSHVARGVGYNTGIALINPSATAANVLIQVFNTDGTQVASRQFAIGPGRREIGLLSEVVPEMEGITGVGGYVKVTSDVALTGIEMFFTENLELLSAVPAQPVPQQN